MSESPSRPGLVTVTERVHVRRPPEFVWDFTQDYSRRAQWDTSVIEAQVLATEPAPSVRVRCAGGLRAVFRYKLFERPRRTSLALEDVHSPWIEGGGGSWSYEAADGGTLWTQSNSLVVRGGFWRRLFVPLVRRELAASTRRAMRRAKEMMERAG